MAPVQTHITRSRAFAPSRPKRLRNARKPPWVVEAVLRLRALSGLGCLKIAEVFNRRYADEGMTVGKSFVTKTIKNNACRLLQLRRDIRNIPPQHIPKNGTWALDTTEIRLGNADIAHVVGLIDAGTRANLGLQRLADLSTVAILETLLTAIKQFGKPKTLKTDNGPRFTSRLFRFVLACLNIKHRLSEPHCPWENGRIERFFGTLKTAIRQVAMPLAALPVALDEFRFFYNHVRTHSSLAGGTPAEAWNGISKPDTEPLWYVGWDGVLAGDYYPP